MILMDDMLDHKRFQLYNGEFYSAHDIEGQIKNKEVIQMQKFKKYKSKNYEYYKKNFNDSFLALNNVPLLIHNMKKHCMFGLFHVQKDKD